MHTASQPAPRHTLSPNPACLYLARYACIRHRIHYTPSQNPFTNLGRLLVHKAVRDFLHHRLTA